MNKPTIEDILVQKPEANPRIYAYSIDDAAHEGLLKVGQTTRDVKSRVAEQLKTAAITNYKIELDESAALESGGIISDHAVRAALIAKGFANPQLEWMRCTVADIRTVLTELRTGEVFTGTHHETFSPRAEQTAAVEQTYSYYQSRWDEDAKAAPALLVERQDALRQDVHQLSACEETGRKRVLVVTFKPAVEDAWRTDLQNHVDFDGWRYLSRNTGGDPREVPKDVPLVYFGSFQDLLGKVGGAIKARNEWIHEINWDLVIFDEYHFGAWRELSKRAVRGRRGGDCQI